MANLAWQGADNGREGLLKAEKWLKTLDILGRHEGESITYYSGPLYRDLFDEMPEESWLGRNGDRSLFRDYQKCWTSLGVLRPTQDTDQVVELTQKGRDLLQTRNALEFFRVAIDGYTELWNIDSRTVVVSPYEFIAHALLLFPASVGEVSCAELQKKAELIASVSLSLSAILSFSDSDTSKRRFRSYLTMLENAGAIERTTRGSLFIQDRDYLEDLVREGVLAIEPDAIVMNIEWSDGRFSLPEDIADDLRRRKQSSRVVREGQRSFARLIGKAYSYTCCITGATERSVLQAAHIMQYRGRQTNFASNGLLLAQDVHTLFDKGRLLINPETLCVELSSDMHDERYLKYAGKPISIPEAAVYQPNREALAKKYELSVSR